MELYQLAAHAHPWVPLHKALLGLSCLALLATGFAQAPPTGDKLIIESLKTGNSERYLELEGTWTESWAKSFAPGVTPKGQMASRKCVFSSNKAGVQATPGSAAARFLPKLSSPGHYYVYVTWPDWGNAQPVSYTIKHARGEEQRLLRQNGFAKTEAANSSRWILLGDFDFPAGQDAYVELRIDAQARPVFADELGQVYADAVCFSKSPLSDNVLTWQNASAPGAVAAARPETTLEATPPPGLAASSAMPPVSAALAPSLGSAVQPPTMLATRQGQPPTWLNNLKQAQTTAEQQKRRILIFFDNPLANRCRHYNQVFGDPSVQQALQNFILVKLDFAENLDLATRLSAYCAGTIIVYDS
jgi:hypothetical protein